MLSLEADNPAFILTPSQLLNLADKHVQLINLSLSSNDPKTPSALYLKGQTDEKVNFDG